MIQKISPKYDVSKLASQTTADRVDVYEDRVRGWLIDSARILNGHEHAGFAVLQLGLAYFEALAVFQRGEDSRRRSPTFFSEGFWSVFDQSDVEGLPLSLKDDFDQLMYEAGRCGLFHLGVARNGLLLADGKPVFRVWLDDSNTTIRAILVDRYGFVDRIDKNLSAYAARLRDPGEADLQIRFDRAWGIVHP